MSARTTRVWVDDVEYVVIEWTPPRSLDALTSAERAVAELVACGKSNAEIALARETSVRTVANQVAAILRKLGVSSRVQLAALFGAES